MSVLSEIQPRRVFKYFEEICAIPHGSGDCGRISEYCVNFAKMQGLEYIRDNADNVIIFKDGSSGYENSKPIILQGHLDMVCQKTADRNIDFEKDGLEIFVDGDLVRARGTTLGGDNGIAVATVLAILESNDIPHPPIEAVFTTDEEIGMLGATALDTAPLRAARLINIDSEEDDTVTVSCAGGIDFTATMHPERVPFCGGEVTVALSNLRGGHSGIEINSGRVNANTLLGRLLAHLNREYDFKIIEVNGGSKCNAIPPQSSARIATENTENLVSAANNYLSVIKQEICAREPDFDFTVSVESQNCEHTCLSDGDTKSVIYALSTVPNGIVEMSAEIDGLVETSLNLGILKTDGDSIIFTSALRSNKSTALDFLVERLDLFFARLGFKTRTSGHYPPWEFKSDSELQRVYKECFTDRFGCTPKVEAIHAGLECGVFASKIPNLDCISIGPELRDVHTVNESLSISSTAQIFGLILDILKNSK